MVHRGRHRCPECKQTHRICLPLPKDQHRCPTCKARHKRYILATWPCSRCGRRHWKSTTTCPYLCGCGGKKAPHNPRCRWCAAKLRRMPGPTARAYQALRTSYPALSDSELARRLSVSRQRISQIKRLFLEHWQAEPSAMERRDTNARPCCASDEIGGHLGGEEDRRRREYLSRLKRRGGGPSSYDPPLKEEDRFD